MNAEMMTGKLIRYDEVRGYGFIAPDDGTEDVFVHVNDLEMDKDLLARGARVKFVVDEGERGLKANRVCLANPVQHVRQVSQPSLQELSPGAGSAGPDDTMCDVLTYEEFAHEITEALLTGVPTLSAADLLKVRELVLHVASLHQWIES